MRAHALHARVTLFGRHFQRAANGFGELLDVVGIDEERVAQFAGGAGELAEDQDAVFVLARGDIFLGDEIHAVVQRGDHAEIGGAIVGINLLMGVMAAVKDDGLPLVALKARVDALGFGFHFVEKILIALDVGAAGRAELDEGEAARRTADIFEEALDAAETLEYSLGVVDAVHAEAEENRVRAGGFENRGAA